ncbi:MAG: ornithine cyclodeaminase family protein [Gemmatimonadaceae bacterium]|nr:ornithine cyclodeaminase family protein [Gemmatimonadaceae bacterium]
MPTLLLTDRDVRALLPMPECIEAMADALRCVTAGDAVLPLRTVLRLDGTTNAFAAMPAVLGRGRGAALGAKVITVFPGNEATAFDSHIGVVLLFDAEFGRLLAIADASSITAIRTSAVSGLATRCLAREDASILAILGAGVLAMPHIEAMCAVRPIRSVRIWSRSGTGAGGRAHALAARVRESFGLEVTLADSAAAAVIGADVVCTITSSRVPVLEGRWLSPGAHVNAVGASVKDARELDTVAVQRARLFADRRESVLAESGDFLIPLAEGAVGPGHLLGELGELVTGRIDGRTSGDDVTVFKSLGLAVEDVAALRHIHERAVSTGRGVPIELGGRREHE